MSIGELDPMFTITAQAVLLGLAAGLAPGPLLALVMAESLPGGAASAARYRPRPVGFEMTGDGQNRTLGPPSLAVHCKIS
jgi:hypothetical protein